MLYISLDRAYQGFMKYFYQPIHIDVKEIISKAYKATSPVMNPLDQLELNFNQLELKLVNFRTFLRYLQLYFQLLKIFIRIDKDRNGTLSFNEYKSCINEFKARGITIDNAKESFHQIPKANVKVITFNEFASWAFNNSLNLDDLDINSNKSKKLYRNLSWYQKVISLPITNSQEHINQRNKLYNKWTSKANDRLATSTPVLNISTIRKLICKYLNSKISRISSKMVKKCNSKAFNITMKEIERLNIIKEKTKQIKQLEKDKINASLRTAIKKTKRKLPKKQKQIEKHVFQYYLKTMKQMLEYYYLFRIIDQDYSDHISFMEFEAVVPKLEEIGLTIKNSRDMFDQIDESAGGTISFEEFLNYAVKNQLQINLNKLNKSFNTETPSIRNTSINPNNNVNTSSQDILNNNEEDDNINDLTIDQTMDDPFYEEPAVSIGYVDDDGEEPQQQQQQEVIEEVNENFINQEEEEDVNENYLNQEEEEVNDHDNQQIEEVNDNQEEGDEMFIQEDNVVIDDNNAQIEEEFQQLDDEEFQQQDDVLDIVEDIQQDDQIDDNFDENIDIEQEVEEQEISIDNENINNVSEQE